MSDKPSEPPASSLPAPSLPAVSSQPAAKIPSIPVLSVGTPSRPAPGSSAALAAGIPPSPRLPTPSRPAISTPPAPPVGSDPPRTDSNPPGASRRLAPPPKHKRQSVPAPPDGTPSTPPVETPPVVILRSGPPPALPDVVTATASSPAPAPSIPLPAPVAPAAPPVTGASVPPKPVVQPPRPVLAEPAPAPPRPPSPEPPARPVSVAPPPQPQRKPSPPPRPPSTPPATGATQPTAPVATVATSLPLDLTIDQGGHARVTPHQRPPLPLPRPSEPPPPAHVIVAGDAPASQSKPTPAPAINVMRIIAIGTPKVPAELVEEDVLEEPLSDVEHDEETPTLTRTAPLDTVPDDGDAAEIDDVELAPDSIDEKPATGEVLELGRDEALSVPPDEPATLLEGAPRPPPVRPVAEARSGDFAPAEARSGDFPATETPSAEGKPPPPPLRKPQPPRRSDSSRPRPRRALKRPWWEDIFGEDFTRAVPRLSDKQVAREVDFIEESLGVAKGGVVLDLGCGAGHHAVDLAGRGYGVVGYDLSVYQLALAADVAQERDQKINFLHGDMREMAFDAMFDGIYCWNTSFGYFEEDKNIAVAERVFRALKPGGMFLLDVANRDFAATYSPSQLWYEGDSCVCMDDMNVDFITSRLRVKRSVIFDDGRSRECTYSIRLYSLHELGKLLHEVGFRVAEASGNPSTPGVFFGELSPRLIVLAQKP